MMNFLSFKNARFNHHALPGPGKSGETAALIRHSARQIAAATHRETVCGIGEWIAGNGIAQISTEVLFWPEDQCAREGMHAIRADEQIEGLGCPIGQRDLDQIRASMDMSERTAETHIHLSPERVVEGSFELLVHEGQVLSVHDVAHERDIQLRYLFARPVHVGNEIERDVASCQTVEETHALGDRIASPEKVNGIPLATQMRGPFEHYNGNGQPLFPRTRVIYTLAPERVLPSVLALLLSKRAVVVIARMYVPPARVPLLWKVAPLWITFLLILGMETPKRRR
jgi:hypothetical protein